MSCTQITLWRSEGGYGLKRHKAFLSLFLILFATTVTSYAQTFTSLHSFNGTDGNNPYFVFLAQGFDGNFYGTTYNGGSTGSGNVFKITTGGTLTSIYSFCTVSGCPDGNAVAAGLTLSPSGFFYGTTNGGGASGAGTAYKISPSGTLTTLLSLDSTDGAEPYVGLIQATNGDFYGTASGGGTSNVGTIFQMTPTGTPTLLYNFTGGADGSYPDGRLVQGTNGILYGTSYQPGA